MTNRRQLLQTVATGEAPPPRLVAAAKAELDRREEARRRRLERSRERRRTVRAKDRAELDAKETMHDACWVWNLDHTADRFASYGRCDCGCGEPFRTFRQGELDHWIEQSQGGEDARENGWRLLRGCHQAKSANEPDRSTWNNKRRVYCLRAGVPFEPRKESHT